jgi:hypothetical protein
MMGWAATLDSGAERRNTMQPKYANEASCTARQPVSAEVAQFAERLATRARDLAERTNGKLHSVMTSETPRSCEVLSKDGQEYPPLFADLRGNFVSIASALDSIEYALSRTEL